MFRKKVLRLVAMAFFLAVTAWVPCALAQTEGELHYEGPLPGSLRELGSIGEDPDLRIVHGESDFGNRGTDPSARVTTPEPTSLLLAAAAALGFGAFAVHRRRRLR